MILSKQSIQAIRSNKGLDIPGAAVFSLPEKVLQFGTGVLLRGLPDYFIDKANKQGIFNGRVVVVKSTSQGGTDAFGQQDNLYTICVKGIDGEAKVDEVIINASISRVISANGEWPEILKCAADPQLQIIISNTTEVGIVLVPDDINAAPPASFPGKLLAFLLERYKKFNGSAESGMVIIPTELIPGNGTKLKSIVLELAKQNNLDTKTMEWLSNANDFCNSLVDRIVPGKLPAADKDITESRLGYADDLMIMSEVYRLWAIETGNPGTKEILSFSKADSGVVIAPSIEKFRELKLRLLNGSHTFTCGLAVLLGFTTVKQAMQDREFANFITGLMLDEIAPAINNQTVTLEEARQFALQVLDRYRNPFIEHQWLSICVQYTSKMKMRNVYPITAHYAKQDTVPKRMALGFAAYLLFMRTQKNAKQEHTGTANQKEYVIQDDYAAHLYSLWNEHGNNVEALVMAALQDKNLWGSDLAALPGFAAAVITNIRLFLNKGVPAVFKSFESQKISL